MDGIVSKVEEGVDQVASKLEEIPAAVEASLASLNTLNDLDLSGLMGTLDALLQRLRDIEQGAQDAKAAVDDLGNADPTGGE